MTSPDNTAASNRTELWLANVRVGVLEYRRSWPVPVFLIGELIPTVLRFLVYVLIGRLAGGSQGMSFAFIGCVALAIQADCISGVSDIPVGDADERRFAQVRRGQLPPIIQYTGRAIANVAVALLTAVVVWAALGPVIGDWALVRRVGMALPLLVIAAPLATLFGFAAIAPAIGNDYQNLVHNTAAALVTVTSGAIFPTTVNPALDTVAQVMPIHHLINAMRAVVAGRPWLDQLGWEVVVGIGWGIVSILVYQAFDIRGRRTGRGAFAA